MCAILLAFFLGSLASAEEVPKKMMEYGVKALFKEDQDLLFPDFSLTFAGERHVASSVFKPGFIFYDFRIWKGAEEKTISWSSGTGEISPLKFSISEMTFIVELRMSEKLGNLKENELVIWSSDPEHSVR